MPHISRLVLIPLIIATLVLTGLMFASQSEQAKLSVQRIQGDDKRPPPPKSPPHQRPKFPESHAHRGDQSPNHELVDGRLWTNDDISELQEKAFPSRMRVQYRENNDDRLLSEKRRYELASPWLNDDSMMGAKVGTANLPRFKGPDRNETSDAQYLRQPLAGDFRWGSDKLFMMFKTSADTQWSRMVPHFMTTLTHFENFAIYSDAPGTMFGHEIIDILKDIPQSVIDNLAELERYKAHLKSHDENWNWSPEKLKAEGGWLVDRFKNIPMLADAYSKNPNCDWYVWIDDDSYVFADTFIKWLYTMDPNEYIYTGATAPSFFGDIMYHFAHGGSVAVVSRAVAEALFGPPEKRGHEMSNHELVQKYHNVTADMCCGDAALGFLLVKELGIRLYVHPQLGEQLVWWGGPFQSEDISGIIFRQGRWCLPIATWHHLSAHDTEVLYLYERLWSEDRYITYSDIYRDFYLPYVVEERPNWRLSDVNGTPERHIYDIGDREVIDYLGEHYTPTLSKQECKRLCDAKATCMAWSYKKDYCILSTDSFVFGSAVNKWSGDEGWTTGYMIDRIRQWRNESPCDPLDQAFPSGEWNDDDSTSEGWMLRKMAASRQCQHNDHSTIPKF